MAGPRGKPLGWGDLGELLHRELKPGEEASVLSQIHKGGTEIDAELFRKESDGRIYKVDNKVHLDPKTLKEK